jgi:hypothetical protein
MRFFFKESEENKRRIEMERLEINAAYDNVI